MTALAPLTNVTLRARIAERLRDAILAGELAPGQRLVERKLAADLGTSLTAVREAVIELETEGFIVKRANATTHVTALTLAESLQILEARAVLEAHVLAEAARRATPDEGRALERQYRQLLDAARAADVQTYVRRDLELHRTMWALCKNPFLVAGLERAVLPFFAYAAIRLLDSRPASVDLVSDARAHHGVVEGIRRGDAEAVGVAFARAMRVWEADTRAHLYEAARGGAP